MDDNEITLRQCLVNYTYMLRKTASKLVDEVNGEFINHKEQNIPPDPEKLSKQFGQLTALRETRTILNHLLMKAFLSEDEADNIMRDNNLSSWEDLLGYGALKNEAALFEDVRDMILKSVEDRLDLEERLARFHKIQNKIPHILLTSAVYETGIDEALEKAQGIKLDDVVNDIQKEYPGRLDQYIEPELLADIQRFRSNIIMERSKAFNFIAEQKHKKTTDQKGISTKYGFISALDYFNKTLNNYIVLVGENISTRSLIFNVKMPKTSEDYITNSLKMVEEDLAKDSHILQEQFRNAHAMESIVLKQQFFAGIEKGVQYIQNLNPSGGPQEGFSYADWKL